MNLHEYQGKEILEKFNVKVQKGYVADNPDDAVKCAEKINKETGTKIFVIKAQIHAGGRGKGGGVKIAKNLEPKILRSFFTFNFNTRNDRRAIPL